MKITHSGYISLNTALVFTGQYKQSSRLMCYLPYSSFLLREKVFCGHYAKVFLYCSFQTVFSNSIFAPLKYLFEVYFRGTQVKNGKGK